MQSLEFTKSLNFGSNSKKKLQKKKLNYNKKKNYHIIIIIIIIIKKNLNNKYIQNPSTENIEKMRLPSPFQWISPWLSMDFQIIQNPSIQNPFQVIFRNFTLNNFALHDELDIPDGLRDVRVTKYCIKIYRKFNFRPTNNRNMESIMESKIIRSEILNMTGFLNFVFA